MAEVVFLGTWWYVFPPTDSLFSLGAVIYFMFMAIPSFFFLEWWCEGS